MSPVGSRMSAEQRREQVLLASIPHFARGGLAGTSTEEIARSAGISHPYLFRLFPTKKALFLAAVERGFDRALAGFAAAGEGLSGQEALESMGASYSAYLADRDLLLLQMQAYAAADDAEVREVARAGFGRLWNCVEERSGADAEQLRGFFAMGMLFNVIASLDLASYDARWAVDCVPPQQLPQAAPEQAG